MENVGVIGLGLIGGSMAKTIRANSEFNIYGMDADKVVIERAFEEKIIDGILDENTMQEMDFVIVALYPKDVCEVIDKYSCFMKKNTIVVDCTGVKSVVCNALSKKLLDKDIYFIGGHPMAGKEVSGYFNADSNLYNNASMILCRDEYTNESAFATARDFFKTIGFPRIKESTPTEHDQVIAFTSQLAHVVSSAYVKSPTLHERYGFSAGSFKDLTRVAKLNENMWTDLFFVNKEALLKEINTFIDNVTEYRDALENDEIDKMRCLLKEGRQLKENDEEKEINGNSKNS